ncbi:MAG TPA: aminotransferase class V-fold PLP-dependent enzyme, partial [Blastocatellia bacterium]|nr:aminotransferase class V-fold PLP-dependent enzyme [Blastocatellia bacterium]
MTIDIDRARAETPGCEHVLHFNNAGAALPPQSVLDAVIDHLRLEASIGGYEAADAAVPAGAPGVINARRDEIALVDHATLAWDLAFYSVPLAVGDRILTSVSEYAANYVAFLHAARRTGAVIEVVPNDEAGQVDVAALE